MNSTDLADGIAKTQGLTKAQAKAIVDQVLQAITDAAVAGEEVSLPGFGKFKVQARPEREGRNPRTGETMTIAASNQPKFKAGKALKDAVN